MGRVRYFVKVPYVLVHRGPSNNHAAMAACHSIRLVALNSTCACCIAASNTASTAVQPRSAHANVAYLHNSYTCDPVVSDSDVQQPSCVGVPSVLQLVQPQPDAVLVAIMEAVVFAGDLHAFAKQRVCTGM